MKRHSERASRRFKSYPLILVTVIASALFGGEIGNFAKEYQKAVALRRKGATEAAEKAFIALAEEFRKAKYVRGRCNDAAYGGAVGCAIQRKDYERANELAGKIQNEPMRKLHQMEILRAQRNWDELLRISRDEDLAAWPDRFIYKAALLRARARERDEPEAAAEDFILAAGSTMDPDKQASTLRFLGDLYVEQLKDEDKAFTTFAKIAELPARPRAKNPGATAYALLLAKRGKKDDALAVLDKCEADDAGWKCMLLRCRGDVLAISGERDEALACYQKAAAVPDAPAKVVADVKKKIAEIKE